MMMHTKKRITHTDQERENALKMLAMGYNSKQVAGIIGVSLTTIYRWQYEAK